MFFLVGYKTEVKEWNFPQRGENKNLIAERRLITLFFIIQIPVFTTWKLVSEDGTEENLRTKEVKENFGIEYNDSGSITPSEKYKEVKEEQSIPLDSSKNKFKDLENTTEKQPNLGSKIWNFVKYLLSIFIFIISLLLIRNSFSASFVLMIAGLLILPAFNNFLKANLDFEIPKIACWLLVPILLFSIIFFVDTSKNADGTKIDKVKEQQKKVKKQQSKAEQLTFIKEKYKDLALLKVKLDSEKKYLTEKPCDEAAFEGKNLSKIDYQYLERFKEFIKEEKPSKKLKELQDWNWLTDNKLLQLSAISEIKSNEYSISDTYKTLQKLYSDNYLLVFFDEEKNLPLVLDKSFISGQFKGWILVTDLTNKKVVCANKLHVENSSSVNVWSRGFVTKTKRENALLDNFKNNFKNEFIAKTKEMKVSLWCKFDDIFCFKP